MRGLLVSPEARPQPDWERVGRRVRVVKLGVPVLLLIPSLVVSAIPKGTRGISFFPGKIGLALGGVLIAVCVFMGVALFPSVGLLAPVLVTWVIGTTGAAMIVSYALPMAFVKPICTECRLLPLVKEHEAIHLSGVASEKEVWDSMKTRYSVESLSLEGDPAICTFCPIPKRLKEK